MRGLYSGGTFCYEATLLLGETLRRVYSNTPVGTADALEDVWRSRAHTLVDLGDDVFTRGRPHPMIDHRLRNERILPRGGAIPRPRSSCSTSCSATAPMPTRPARWRRSIARGDGARRRAGRALAVVGFVCGTAADPQNLQRQEAGLREAGMLLAASNAQAVRLAARIAEQARRPGKRARGGGD